jgi:hypothetical protein
MVHMARAEAIERWSLRRESAPNGQNVLKIIIRPRRCRERRSADW